MGKSLECNKNSICKNIASSEKVEWVRLIKEKSVEMCIHYNPHSFRNDCNSFCYNIGSNILCINVRKLKLKKLNKLFKK